MYCPACGNGNPDGVVWCIWCKEKLPEQEQEKEQEQGVTEFVFPRSGGDARDDQEDSLRRRAMDLDERERALREREEALRVAELEARELAVYEREEAVARRERRHNRYDDDPAPGGAVPGRACMCWAFWLCVVGVLFFVAVASGGVALPADVAYLYAGADIYAGYCIITGILALIGWLSDSRVFAVLTVLSCVGPVVDANAPFQLVVGILALVAVFRLPRRRWVR